MLGLFEGSNSAGEYANACHAKGIKHACLRGTEERAANGGQVFTQRERQRETGGERASSYSRGIVNIWGRSKAFFVGRNTTQQLNWEPQMKGTYKLSTQEPDIYSSQYIHSILCVCFLCGMKSHSGFLEIKFTIATWIRQIILSDQG